MKKFVLPASMAVLVAASSLALAATNTVGTVKDFNAKNMTLTLTNGTTYYLPKHFKDPGIKAGEKVSVAWTMVKKHHDASSVSIIK
jgi:opacity protein-like surface antigen